MNIKFIKLRADQKVKKKKGGLREEEGVVLPVHLKQEYHMYSPLVNTTSRHKKHRRHQYKMLTQHSK